LVEFIDEIVVELVDLEVGKSVGIVVVALVGVASDVPSVVPEVDPKDVSIVVALDGAVVMNSVGFKVGD